MVHISSNMTLVILMRKPGPWFLVTPRTKSKESTLNLSRAIKKQPGIEKWEKAYENKQKRIESFWWIRRTDWRIKNRALCLEEKMLCNPCNKRWLKCAFRVLTQCYEHSLSATEQVAHNVFRMTTLDCTGDRCRSFMISRPIKSECPPHIVPDSLRTMQICVLLKKVLHFFHHGRCDLRLFVSEPPCCLAKFKLFELATQSISDWPRQQGRYPCRCRMYYSGRQAQISAG